MFNMINIGERAGSGVPDIYSVWKQEGWGEPLVQEQYGPDRTILVLPMTKKRTIKSGDKKVAIKSYVKTQGQHAKIISFMEFDKEYKTADIEALLSIKSSRARKLLNELTEAGVIKKEGGNRDRKYVKIKQS